MAPALVIAGLFVILALSAMATELVNRRHRTPQVPVSWATETELDSYDHWLATLDRLEAEGYVRQVDPDFTPIPRRRVTHDTRQLVRLAGADAERLVVDPTWTGTC